MSVDDSVLQKLHSLPPDKQQEVLDFLEFLQRKAGTGRSRVRLRGLFSDLGVRISEDDIIAARREMWGQFPREDV